jgi:tetratricopeptide (TPR) repeat protein
VILCTVASNLKGWPPNQSRFADEVPFEARQLVQARLAAARQAIAAGAAPQALALLEQAAAVDATYAATRYELGRALEAAGRYDDARRAYVAARDLDSQPSRAPSEHNEAIRRIAREEGAHLVDIERLFEAAAEHGLVGFDLIEDYVHPKPEAHRMIARELWRTIEAEGLAGPAREPNVAVFDQAIDRLGATADASHREAPPSFLFNVAVVLEKQGLDEQAMEKYRACLALDPGYDAARFNLGRLLFGQGRYAEAAEEQRRVLEVAPNHLRAMIGLAEALRRLDRPQDAERVVRRALELDPLSHDAWGSLGGALTQLGDLRGAEQAFRKASELDPKDAAARVDLGLTLLFQGQVAQAEQALAGALALKPDDLRARNGIAAVYTEQGRLDEAERLFRENLAADPTNAFARGGLLKVQERRRANGRPS